MQRSAKDLTVARAAAAKARRPLKRAMDGCEAVMLPVGRRWLLSEDAELCRTWSIRTLREQGIALQRSQDAIRHRARYLGLKSSRIRTSGDAAAGGES